MLCPRHFIPTVTLLLWVFCIQSSLKAATITVTNFDGARSNLLANSAGMLLTRGTVRVGSFNFTESEVRAAFERQTPAQIMAAFTQFGQSIGVRFDGLPGLYQSTIQETITEGHALLGESIYTVITETPTLEAAAEWLVYRHEQVFLEDPTPISPALLNESSAGTLLVGTFGRSTASVGQIIDSPVYALSRVIPEPATASLTLLSIMLLVVPRRRKRIFGP